MLTTVWIFRSYRSMPKLPLLGVDWLGGLMWGLIVLCIIFVCVYGEHYDWCHSVYIRAATVAGLVMLLLNLWRASFIRHPYIPNQTWMCRPVYLTFILYMVVDIFLAPSHLFEHIYMGAILGYGELHIISYNWIILLGSVLGAVFSYFTFARRKWKYKTMTLLAFLSILGYLMWFYFYIDYNLPKASMYLPLFLRGGWLCLDRHCLSYFSLSGAFSSFLQCSVHSIAGQCRFCRAIGAAILERGLNVVMKKNVMVLGAGLDRVNSVTAYIQPGPLYGMLQ